MTGAALNADLWEFECPCGHGSFDVWGTDWENVDPLDRPGWCRNAPVIFEPESVRATRCPRCLAPGQPVGARESLA